jgi:drug/metabolite transporter (DMT)-like permease
MALPLYFLLRKRDPESFKRREDEAKAAGKITEFNKLRISVSALCDVFASTMQCIALNFISGSAYQMMRGGTIATTFLFTVIYLKQKALKNQILGSGLAVIGVLIVGAANLIFSATSSGSSNTVQWW